MPIAAEPECAVPSGEQLPDANVSLVANGDHQNPAGWRQLELALIQQLGQARVRPNLWGPSLSLAALSMVGVIGWYAPLIVIS